MVVIWYSNFKGSTILNKLFVCARIKPMQANFSDSKQVGVFANDSRLSNVIKLARELLRTTLRYFNNYSCF